MPVAIANTHPTVVEDTAKAVNAIKSGRPRHVRTLTTHTGLAELVPAEAKVTSFIHLIRQWAPLMSELSRYPFSHPEDEVDSLPLHLTLEDYKAGLKPFAWIRPRLAEGLATGWGTQTCPLIRYVDSASDEPFANGCWYFSDSMLDGGFETMSNGLRQVVHHLHGLGLTDIKMGE